MAEILDVVTRLSYDFQGGGLNAANQALEQQLKLTKELNNQRGGKTATNDLIQEAKARDINASAALKEAKATTEVAKAKKLEAQAEQILLRIKQNVEKSQEKAIALRTREQKQLDELSNDYKQLSLAYSDAKAKAQEYSATLGHNHPVAIQYQQDADKILQALLKIDKRVGDSRRQIGNYNLVVQGLGKSLNSLNFATSQIVRELAAFTFSWQTGLLAVSNNIPIFIDRLEELRAQGASSREIFRAIGASIVSLNGIITIAIAFMTIFGKKLLDTSEDAGKAKKSIDDLTKGVDDFAKMFSNADNVLDKGTNSIKRRIENLKALGVANGQVFNSQKQIFDAEQDLRKQEEKDLIRTISIYEQVQKIAGNKEGFRKGALPIGANFGREIFNKPSLQSQISGLPKELQETIRQELESGELTARKLYDRINELKESQKDKNNEISAAETEFNSDLKRQEFELSEQLDKQIRSKRAELNVEKRKDETESFELIKQRIGFERNQNLALINDEIEQARRKGILTTNIESKYNSIKAQINEEYRLEQLKKDKEFIQERVDFQASLNKNQLDAAKVELKTIQDTGQDSFFVRQRIAQLESQVEIDSLNKKYREQTEAARQAGEDTTALTVQYNQDVENANDNSQRLQLKALEDYYDERLNIIKRNEKRIENAILSGRGTNKRKERRLLEERVKGAQLGLTEAEANVSRVANNPNATTEDLNEAADKLNQAKISVKNTKQELIDFDTDYARHIVTNVVSVIESIASALTTVYQMQEAQLNAVIERQTTRVEQARVLLERGNIDAYKTEVDRLDKLQVQREAIAKKQLQVNSLLVASNSAVAVTEAIGAVIKVASGGDPYTAAARVAAAALAVVAAIASIKTAFSSNGFAEGVVGINGKGTSTSDSIPARLSKGESVITAKATAKNRDLLELANKGYDLHMLMQPKYQEVAKSNSKQTEKLLQGVIDTVSGLKFRAENRLDRNGVHQLIETEQKIERNRWK